MECWLIHFLDVAGILLFKNEFNIWVGNSTFRIEFFERDFSNSSGLHIFVFIISFMSI